MTHHTRLLRNITFGCAGITVLVLIAATIIEHLRGTAFAHTHIYGSPFFVALWALTAATAVAYLIARHMTRRIIVLWLHLAFVVILAGALVTHVTGSQGTVHLRQGDAPTRQYRTADGNESLPFGVSLKDFELAYYHGTRAPMDFISRITIHDGNNATEGEVSMNHIYSYRHYRFYQLTYDSDGMGSTLTVYHDPYGIGITYAGYALLLLGMVLFFFDPTSHFRQLLRHPALRKAALCMAVVSVSATASAAGTPRTLPAETAARFGDLYVYYNDRVCPLQTLARDFTAKLYGKTTYRGLTAEQVFMGWFFYYDDWKDEPMIHIKSREVRELLGIKGNYARLSDFYDYTGYKLGAALQEGTAVTDLRGARDADEKCNLALMVSGGNALKIFPYRENDSVPPTWYSVADRLPASMSHEQWVFTRYCMNYIAEQVARQDYAAADTLLAKTKKFQTKEAGGYLPSPTRFGAEKIYNAMDATRPVAMACLAIGILSFAYYCRRMASRRALRTAAVGTSLTILMSVLCLYLATMLTLRGIVSGHFPASNGFETMQLMACCVTIVALACHRRYEIILSFGFMLCGLALLVAMMGESNPSVTPLMPVLSSPLLSIHVVTIMTAYALFGFAMFNGIAACIVHRTRPADDAPIVRLQVLSHIMLYPAIFLLTAGIFIGAIWANVSWGRYWGWDPKEVWALITLLIYAAALHGESLPALRKPMNFHRFTVIAFLSVLITYFGVNFFLGGLHGYA